MISVQEMEGQQVLVIDSVHGEEMYSSYIYLEDGSLKELFVKKADFAGLEGGQELVELESFSVDRPKMICWRFLCRQPGSRRQFISDYR